MLNCPLKLLPISCWRRLSRGELLPFRETANQAGMPSNTPEPSDKLWISSLTCMIFWLNASLGSGKGSHITFADVYREIDRGTLFTFLEQELGPMPTLSMLRLGGDHEQAPLFAAAM